MGEKSHVSMEQKMCFVTGKPFDSGAILLDTKMKNSLERNTLTGWGFSPEVEKKFKKGYVALVGVDPVKSVINNGKILSQDAWRTGKIAYIRRSVVDNVLTGFPEDLQWSFVEDEVIDKLAEMVEK